MDEMKRKLCDTVDARLAAAPDSTAKAELVEELGDNLYQRYCEMTAQGMPEADAFQKAVDELGDTAELVDYLKSLSPDEPLPRFTRPEPSTGSQLDDLFRDVEAIVSGALDRAKNAVMEAKQTFQETGSYDWTSPGGRVEVHIGPDGEDDPEDDEEWDEEDEADADAEDADAEEAGEPASGSRAWGFSADIDLDKGSFFAGGGPKEQDKVYGFGYDKARGGFYTQWGQEKADPAQEPPEGGGAPALRAIDIVVDGDVTIRMGEAADGEVSIGGDVDELEVRRTDDGVLTIRQGGTASSSFFFRRGLSAADVDLSLPLRHWDRISVATTNGSVQLDGDGAVDRVSVKTASGDLTARLARCGAVSFRSTSGDFSWEGALDEGLVETISGDLTLRAPRFGKLLCRSTSGQVDVDGDGATFQTQTMSGDIRFHGKVEDLSANAMSGDVQADGAVMAARCASASGDVRLDTSVLPRQLALSSKSGDCAARIPGSGPFTATFKTTSGEARSPFFTLRGPAKNLTFDYHGGGPAYQLTSVSGDLLLDRR